MRSPRAARSGAVSAPVSAAPTPTLSFRVKRVAATMLLQQAWQHADGLEWRAVDIVPEQAPNWEPRDDAATSPPR